MEERVLWSFYAQSGFHPLQHFLHLGLPAYRILDGCTLPDAFFSVSVEKRLSSTFFGRYALSLPFKPVCSFAVSSHSLPLSSGAQRVTGDGERPWLVMGSWHGEGERVNGLVACRWSPVWLTVTSFRSHLRSYPSSHTRDGSIDVSYTSAGETLGCRSLLHLDELHRFAIGSELYLSPMEKTGGVSLGVRYHSPSPREQPRFMLDPTFNLTLPTLTEHDAIPAFNRTNISSDLLSTSTSIDDQMIDEKHDQVFEADMTDLALVVNPIMGHLQASYATTLHPNCMAAARYEYNVYSYEAGLGLGLVFRHQNGSRFHISLNTAHAGGMVRWERWINRSVKLAFGCRAGAAWAPAETKFGFNLTYSPDA